MENKNLVVLFIVIILAIAGVFYMYSFTGNELSNVPNAPIQPEGVGNIDRRMINFQNSGYIVMNNPGMQSDTLFFIYEEPGSPALTAEIILDSESMCIFDGNSIDCQSLSAPLSMITENKLVRVTGFLEDGKLYVVTIVKEVSI